MELLEREQCLADLEGWLGTALREGGCTVLVTGEAGIGKTALLWQFAKRQSTARVLWAVAKLAREARRPAVGLYKITAGNP
jgi:predicted ATP-dependent serine protease